ncbi:MAG: hypothetical protein JNL80_05785 [Phycisphaerae bacterium]|nr:hypothetical protein [Phycisphaerae bacterium]
MTKSRASSLSMPGTIASLSLLSTSLLTAGVGTASAADRLWLAPTNGTFSDPTRWAGGVPGTGDAAIFGSAGGGPFVVSVSLPHLISSLSVTNQQLTLDASAGGGLTLLGGLNVKGLEAAAPSLTLANGAFVASGPIAVGGTGVVGDLRQSNGFLIGPSLSIVDGSWSTSGSSTVAINGAVVIGDGVGHEANARLDGGVTIATNLSPWVIGQNSGTGSLTLGTGVAANFGSHSVFVGGSASIPGTGTLHLESGASITAPALRIAPVANGSGTLVLDGGAGATLVESLFLGPGEGAIEATDASIQVPNLRLKSSDVPLNIALHGASTFTSQALSFEMFSQAIEPTTFTLSGGADLSLGSIKIANDFNIGLIDIDILDPGSVVELGSYECTFTQTVGLGLRVASGSAVTIDSVSPNSPIDCAWVIDGAPGSISIGTPPSLHGTFEVTVAGSSTLAPGEEAVLLDAPLECIPDGFAVAVTQSPNEAHLALVDNTGIRLRRLARKDTIALDVAPTIPAHLRMPCRLVATVDGTEYDVTRQATVVSGNPNIVASLGNGLIRGVAPGTTTLTATIDGRKLAVQVTVQAEDPAYPYEGVTLTDYFAGNHHSAIGPAGLSADGRWVAFESFATNLDANDAEAPPNYPLVFVHDRLTDETVLASVTSGGEAANGFARVPAISADGRYVVFLSGAPNLGGGASNATALVLRDRTLGVTETLVPGTVNVGEGVGYDPPRISDDGRYVLFRTKAAIDPADTNATTDAYLIDRQLGTTVRVGLDLNLVESPLGTWAPTMTADGRQILYWVERVGGEQLMVHDLDAGVVTALTDVVTTEAGGPVAAISADGSRVAYRTWVGPAPFETAMWLVDRPSGSTTLLHQAPRVSDSLRPRLSISGDGSYVVSVAMPTDEVDCGELREVVLLHDVAGGTTSVVSQRPGIDASIQEYSTASISRDASTVGFATYGADKIVPHEAPAAFISQVVVWRRVDAAVTGDLNGDGTVNAADLAILLGNWGSAGASDLNQDGTTDPVDLAILLGAWS